MKIAIVGLGKMGSQISQKLKEGGHEVIAYDINKDSVEKIKAWGVTPAYTREEVVSLFDKESCLIWMMVPAEIIREELTEWLKLVPKNSILIDGGNSDFRKTKVHATKVLEAGSLLIDVGTSGGVWGYANGFSMMVGGDRDTYQKITPILETLKQPLGAYQYFGESGSGHYVKMVHNAIEYGMMESIAEGYRLLKEGPYKDLDLVAAGEVWQHRSVITSWLNELTIKALRENRELKNIEGVVAESGEARFALEVATSLNIGLPAIASALNVRIKSQQGETNFATKLLALMRNAFGGHKINEK